MLDQMDSLSPTQLAQRLAAFHSDLREMPADASCPEPLARVFNQLLKESKRTTGEDPIVRSIRVVDESANPGVGAVRTLAGQLLVAVGGLGGAANGGVNGGANGAAHQAAPPVA